MWAKSIKTTYDNETLLDRRKLYRYSTPLYISQPPPLYQLHWRFPVPLAWVFGSSSSTALTFDKIYEQNVVNFLKFSISRLFYGTLLRFWINCLPNDLRDQTEWDVGTLLHLVFYIFTITLVGMSRGLVKLCFVLAWFGRVTKQILHVNPINVLRQTRGGRGFHAPRYVTTSSEHFLHPPIKTGPGKVLSAGK